MYWSLCLTEAISFTDPQFIGSMVCSDSVYLQVDCNDSVYLQVDCSDSVYLHVVYSVYFLVVCRSLFLCSLQ
jgi:hypothetical protein